MIITNSNNPVLSAKCVIQHSNPINIIKWSGSNNCTYEIYPYNVTVFRNSADTFQQKLLIQDCNDKLQKMPIVTGSVYTGEDLIRKTSPTSGFSYDNSMNNEHKSNGVPECLELASYMYRKFCIECLPNITKLNDINDIKIPIYFDAKGLWALFYKDNNGLGYHQDTPQKSDWAFILTLGAITEMKYYHPSQSKENAHTILLHSGDAIFFNGRVLYHAISKIYEHTMPDWWEEDYSRVCLQMRGEEHV